MTTEGGDKIRAMMELIDGAMEVVETWGETPYQKQWAREWVEKARAVLLAESNEKCHFLQAKGML